jgi:hypothetical protein
MPREFQSAPQILRPVVAYALAAVHPPMLPAGKSGS